jgi:putative ABC transport system permease protein
MKSRKLADHAVSAVSFGCMNLSHAYGPPQPREVAERVLRRALELGKTVRWGNGDWVVVGTFSDDGGIAESEAWADARLVQQVWKRGSSFQSVRARLTDDSDATLKRLKDTLTKDPRVQVAVKREPEFYAEQQAVMATLINGAGWVFAIMMGLAAIFAAVNTMFNAVASRASSLRSHWVWLPSPGGTP